MGDPVENVLDEIDPSAPPEEVKQEEKPVVAGVTLTREDYDEMVRKINEASEAQRYTPPQQARPVEHTQDDISKMDEQFWTSSPTKAAARVAQEVMAPAQQAMNAKLGSLALANFRASKTNDPFFHVAMPLFNQRMSSLEVANIGAMNDKAQQDMFDIAWDAACGAWSRQRQAEKAKKPPQSMGGGANGGPTGGPRVKKLLSEIDPVAYRMAVENGFSEEEMAKLAEEIEGEE